MSRITSLPPASAIADPAVREFCEAVFNVVEGRSGNVEGARDERFITYNELGALVEDEVLDMFGTGSAISTPGRPRPPGSVEDRMRRITNRIMNSELWRVLGEEFRTLTIPNVRALVGPLSDGITAINTITTTSSSVAARTLAGLQVSFNDMQAQIVEINTVTADSNSASAQHLFALTARVGTVEGDAERIEAGLTTEISARVNNRTALASAINTIWTMFGSESQAIAQSGDSLQSNAIASQAVKWDQVQAAVTDPDTGRVSSAAILQESRAYANGVENKLEAMYTVRAQVTSGGRTMVGGFGIVGGVNDVTDYPVFDFGVRADTFWIGTPSGADIQRIPFVVVTTPGQVYDGVTYNDVGVWMSTSMISNATITYAQIEDTIASDNFVSGVSGWEIRRELNIFTGFQAEFSNVRVRGHIEATSGSFGRLLVTDAVEGSEFVANNTGVTVTHGENRRVMVTLWVPGSTGQLAYLADVDMNSFTIRCALAGDATVAYRYW